MKQLLAIDCENICINNIKDIISKITNYEILLFFGHKQRIKNLPLNPNLEIIQADGHAPNYLDFQLITELAIRSQKEKISNIYIVSNDNGFDAAVNQLSRHGIEAKRLNIDEFNNTFSTNNINKKSTIIKSVVISNDETSKQSTLTEKQFKEKLKKLGQNNNKYVRQACMILTKIYKNHKFESFSGEALNEIISPICKEKELEKMKNCITKSKIISGPKNKKQINIDNLDSFVKSLTNIK